MLVIRQTNNRHLKNINFVLFSLHLTEKDAQKVGFARKWCAEHPFAVLVKTLRLIPIFWTYLKLDHQDVGSMPDRLFQISINMHCRQTNDPQLLGVVFLFQFFDFGFD